jgi:peroxiredoxin Q/BCP
MSLKAILGTGLLSAGLVLILAGARGMAEDAKAEAVELKVGDPAPEFTVKDDTGKDWKSSDHFGKKLVVVYFYPADMTGGCTKQACGFRDDIEKLKEAGVEVVGVSGDSVHNHQLFKQEKNLPFALLADEKGEVAAKFGVPHTKETKTVETTIAGKPEKLTRNVTIKRWTFLVDQDMKIAYKNDQVDAAKDSQVILDLVSKLK